MKLAYFSPLNPQPSGISDYSEELLPYLAAHAEIDLFVDGFRPTNNELVKNFRWFDYRAKPEILKHLGDYHATIYHLGNDHRYHTGIVRLMREHPGVVVFHDFALQDYFWGLAIERGDMRWYLDELEACHGPEERARAQEHSGRGAVPPQLNAPLRFPMNLRLAHGAEGIIVHSHWGREQFARIAPNVPIAQIPMAVLPKHASQPSTERNGKRLNIASFGLIIPGKGIGKTVRALSALRDEFDFHYTLVGADNSYFDVKALIKSYRMGDRVTITGHLPLEEFERWILKTDVAVNLRERTVGETSASLFRIMAAGVPAIVSNVGSFVELPGEAVVKVDNDKYADALLMSYLRRLLDDGDLRTRIGANARRHILKEHNVEKTARSYIDFIREVIARRELVAASSRRVEVVPTVSSKVEKSTPPDSSHTPTSTSSSRQSGIAYRTRRPPSDGMKLAYFSPLNPQPSGISDYSEELLPYLAAQADIDLFVEGFRPSNPELLRNFRWFDYQGDPKTLYRLRDYDAILYHFGNDHRYHTGMDRVMRGAPGVVVFHDFALQDFFLGQARNEGDMSIYLDELEACYGKEERASAEECLRRGILPPQVNSPLAYPLNDRLARLAEGIIVHSEWSRERLSKIAPGVPIARIHHHITARAAATPPTIKEDADGRVMIASFGLITPDKGIERALRALAALRDEHDFHYTLVGPSGNYPALSQLIKSYGLQDHVTVTSEVSLREFEQRIAETDIAINLRERPVGATSGSLCRIMAAGVPAIVSNVAAFSEFPDDAIVKIDVDEYTDALLQAYLRRLIQDRSLGRRIGQNARRHVLAEHNIESSAAGYLDFIWEVIKRRPRSRLVNTIGRELSLLGLHEDKDSLLRSVAAEIAILTPAAERGGMNSAEQAPENGRIRRPGSAEVAQPNGPSTNGGDSALSSMVSELSGRLPKLEGIDYKRAAIEYLGKLSEERSHHLRTKPFYNLANKPSKYKGEGMDEDTHRHFCDFANMAVALALPVGAKILDVGCGSGWLSEYFARLGYQVTGIDISPDLIAMSRDRVARLPFGVDHETPLRCDFAVHDVEAAPLAEKFDVIICYDSLHHFEDERAVMRHLAAMLDPGGLLFILEGQKPDDDSTPADELRDVMREFGTLESPFSDTYLRALLNQSGFAIVGKYVSINGLFEREMLEDDGGELRLPLRTIPIDYHYLTCMKLVADAPATSVPDSRYPGVLRSDFEYTGANPLRVEAGKEFEVPVTITNTGDTLWLAGQTVRAGIVMPGVKILDDSGKVISERHGHPMLSRAVPPGQTISLNVECTAPEKPGSYTARIDLVAQHVCWFAERESEPLVLNLEVETNNQ